MINQEAILEGLLYVMGEEGLSEQQIIESMEISSEELREIASSLSLHYQERDSGLELVQYGGIYKFISRPECKSAIQRAISFDKQRQLSQSALETLAIIAYKQPITRIEIEEIRGVQSDMMCRKLVALDLIRESGRSDAPGRPILYEVTQNFLDGFKLSSLNELPTLPEYSEDENENIFND